MGRDYIAAERVEVTCWQCGKRSIRKGLYIKRAVLAVYCNKCKPTARENAYDFCECGQRKQKRAAKCNECFLDDRRVERVKCYCGCGREVANATRLNAEKRGHNAYATHECASRHKRENKLARIGAHTKLWCILPKWFTCSTCGAEFSIKTPRDSKSTAYCSEACKPKPRGPYKKKHKWCNNCGVSLGTANRKLCDKCLIRSKADRRRKEEHKYRCRKAGTKYDNTVTLTRLFERDGGVCVICSCKCRRTFDPVSEQATMDHVRAITNGGSHTWDNVILTCRKCNTAKNAKNPPQCREAGLYPSP